MHETTPQLTHFLGFALVCGFLRAFCGFLRSFCGQKWYEQSTFLTRSMSRVNLLRFAHQSPAQLGLKGVDGGKDSKCLEVSEDSNIWCYPLPKTPRISGCLNLQVRFLVFGWISEMFFAKASLRGKGVCLRPGKRFCRLWRWRERGGGRNNLREPQDLDRASKKMSERPGDNCMHLQIVTGD